MRHNAGHSNRRAWKVGPNSNCCNFVPFVPMPTPIPHSNSILLFKFFILGWDSNPIEWFSNPKTWFYSCLYSQQGHQINCWHCSLWLATFLSKFLYKFAGIIKTQGNPVVGAKYASNYFRRGTSMSFYPNFYLKFIQSFVKKKMKV